MSSAVLVAEAQRLLDRGTRHDNRMAAWYARSACEDTIARHLQERGLDMGHATMKSQLICLEALDPNLAQHAGSVWGQLSSACHHHAYDLAPTGPEVAGYLAQVRALADQVAP